MAAAVKRDTIDASQRAVEFTFALVGVYVIPALIISSVILAMQATNLISTSNRIEAGIIWIGGLVMTISTELASAGAFKLARAMEARGHNAALIKFMGYVLFVLVVITVCFAKFGITGAWNDVLMIARIAAALLYALVAHSQDDSGILTQEQQSEIEKIFNARIQQIENQIKTFNHSFQSALIENRSAIESSFQSVLIEKLAEIENGFQSSLQEITVTTVSREISRLTQVSAAQTQRQIAAPVRKTSKPQQAGTTYSAAQKERFVHEGVQAGLTLQAIIDQAAEISMQLSMGTVHRYKQSLESPLFNAVENFQSGIVENETPGEIEIVPSIVEN